MSRISLYNTRDEAPHYQHAYQGNKDTITRLSNICFRCWKGQIKVLDKRISTQTIMNDFYTDLSQNQGSFSFLRTFK
jgi:hypothetical protein